MFKLQIDQPARSFPLMVIPGRRPYDLRRDPPDVKLL
jgi:hypothetical protein